jgi:hypothetical protein
MHRSGGQVHEELERLQQVLAANHEPAWADMVGSVLAGPEDELRAFLESNDLWGGSGSLADMAGVERERAARRRIEWALIELGEAQLRTGVANQRTSMWVEAFRKWQSSGI